MHETPTGVDLAIQFRGLPQISFVPQLHYHLLHLCLSFTFIILHFHINFTFLSFSYSPFHFHFSYISLSLYFITSLSLLFTFSLFLHFHLYYPPLSLSLSFTFVFIIRPWIQFGVFLHERSATHWAASINIVLIATIPILIVISITTIDSNAHRHHF